MNRKIGIIGSGIVAKTLGTGFIKKGDQVKLGTRDLAKLDDWKSENIKSGAVGSMPEAADFAELIVLAVSGKAALEALNTIGSEFLDGKTIIDATNPISDLGPQNGVLNFFTDVNRSLMEDLQAAFPKAHFVKAFNSVGSAFMVDPSFEMKPSMFICGNNEDSKSEVKSIVEDFGWEVEDMGKAEAARAIEPLCMLWCIPGFRENSWNHAFKLLKS